VPCVIGRACPRNARCVRGVASGKTTAALATAPLGRISSDSTTGSAGSTKPASSVAQQHGAAECGDWARCSPRASLLEVLCVGQHGIGASMRSITHICHTEAIPFTAGKRQRRASVVRNRTGEGIKKRGIVVQSRVNRKVLGDLPTRQARCGKCHRPERLSAGRGSRRAPAPRAGCGPRRLAGGLPGPPRGLRLRSRGATSPVPARQ